MLEILFIPLHGVSESMIPSLHDTIQNLFSTRRPMAVYSICLAMVIALTYADYVTGDYSLIVFYLVPVSLVAWFAGKRSGLIYCLLVLAARITADELAAPPSFTHSLLHYWNVCIEFLFLVMMSLLFSVLRSNLDKEQQMARIDPLTGALNRRSFFELAEYELNRSRRYKHPFSVAYIDLDNFKAINDTRGHHVGDQLLSSVVSTIRRHTRSCDILARFGGDEFVLLLPETAGEAALQFLGKLHRELNDAMAVQNWPVGFSIGAATYLAPPATVDEVIRATDGLMYDVKHNGKNKLIHQEMREKNHG